MRTFPATLAALLTISAALPAFGQAPPDRTDLNRLNLRPEWTSYLPVDGNRDSIGTVQVIDGDQIFVQTKAGLLIAVDARTGAKQWTFRYPASYVNLYPVGVNEKYIFAVNVANLYCFQRYTGLLEFNYELSGAATCGPVPDHDYVHVVLNGQKIMAYRPPNTIKMPSAEKKKLPEGKNPASQAAARYVTGQGLPTIKDDEFAKSGFKELPTDEHDLKRTPAVTALARVAQPYAVPLQGAYPTPSITTLPSMRQPYQLKPDYMQYNQRTPSTIALPPSVARAYELANLRPKPIEPSTVWSYPSADRISFNIVKSAIYSQDTAAPVSGSFRIWFTTEKNNAFALTADKGGLVVGAPMQDVPSGPMAGPLAHFEPDMAPGVPGPYSPMGFIPLADGNLIALRMLEGSPQNPRIEWRSNVGGLLNRQPLATPDGVFVSGDHSGVTKLHSDTGDIIWKTESTADRVLAVNDEFVYVADRLGTLYVYDRKRATEAATKKAKPLARIELPGFTVPVTNDATDRVVIASESGMLVCMRDISGKYLLPKSIRTNAELDAKLAKLTKADAVPADGMKKEDEPKKEEPKKEEPKKEEPKKEEPKKEEPKKEGN